MGVFRLDFPTRLNELISQREISAYRLSKDTGITERLIGYWRQGEKQPTKDNLIKLADYFDVSVDYLLGRTDNPAVNK